MPHFQLIIISAALIALGLTVSKRMKTAAAAEQAYAVAAMEDAALETAPSPEDYYKDINSVYSLLNVEPVEMEFATALYRL